MSAGELQPAELDELGDRFLAQALDVERAARDEMPQPLEALCGADQSARTTDVDFAFLCHRLAAAFRAMVGEDVGRARLVASQIFDHLRDDVAGALDAHAVADAKAEPRDLVAVVERDVGDDDAADARRASDARPASACRCGRPGCRSLRASSRLSRRGICAPAPSAERGRPGRAAPASPAARFCRRRHRCRRANRRGRARSRDNARASPRRCGSASTGR